MAEGAASQVLQGVVGPTPVEDALAMDFERRQPTTAEEDPQGVRASPETTPGSLRRSQGRLPLRLAGHPLLHGPLRVRLQGEPNLTSPRALIQIP